MDAKARSNYATQRREDGASVKLEFEMKKRELEELDRKALPLMERSADLQLTRTDENSNRELVDVLWQLRPYLERRPALEAEVMALSYRVLSYDVEHSIYKHVD